MDTNGLIQFMSETVLGSLNEAVAIFSHSHSVSVYILFLFTLWDTQKTLPDVFRFCLFSVDGRSDFLGSQLQEDAAVKLG